MAKLCEKNGHKEEKDNKEENNKEKDDQEKDNKEENNKEKEITLLPLFFHFSFLF